MRHPFLSINSRTDPAAFHTQPAQRKSSKFPRNPTAACRGNRATWPSYVQLACHTHTHTRGDSHTHAHIQAPTGELTYTSGEGKLSFMGRTPRYSRVRAARAHGGRYPKCRARVLFLPISRAFRPAAASPALASNS